MTKEGKKMLLIQRATHQNQIEACKIAIFKSPELQCIIGGGGGSAQNKAGDGATGEKKQTETECMKRRINEQENTCVRACVICVLLMGAC